MATLNDVAVDFRRVRDITPTPSSKPAESMLLTPTSNRPHLHANALSCLDTPTPLRTSSTLSTSIDLAPSHDPPVESTSSPASSSSSEAVWTHLTPNEVASLPPSLVREKFLSAQVLITTLTSALHSTRTTAAHSLLQHRLLTLHTLEATERHRVETSLAEREIEVLRRPQIQCYYTSRDGGDATKVLEGEVQRRRMKRMKKQLSEIQAELAMAKRENESLKRMLREGRTRTIANTLQASRRQQRELHLQTRNRTPHHQQVVPTTPKQQIRLQPASKGTIERDDREEHEHKLHTLGYLASQVLSQASLSPTPTLAPVTPTPQRGQHQHKALMSPVLLFPVQNTQGEVENEGDCPPTIRFAAGEKRKRRSRDSTISVEDVEEMRRNLDEDRGARVVGWSPINA